MEGSELTVHQDQLILDLMEVQDLMLQHQMKTQDRMGEDKLGIIMEDHLDLIQADHQTVHLGQVIQVLDQMLEQQDQVED